MRILLLGATGYLGAAITPSLTAAGHHVLAAARSPRAASSHLVEPTAADLDDPHSLASAMVGCDAVILAVGASTDPLADHATVTRQAVARVRRALAAARHTRVRRFLWMGCACTAGAPTDRAVTALDELLPGASGSAFADATWAIEAEVLAANDPHLFTTALLPSALIGPTDHRPTDRSPIAALLAGLPRVLVDTAFNTVDVRDVGRSVMATLAQGRPGQRYLLGGRRTSLAELAAYLHEHHGAPMPTFIAPPFVPAHKLANALDRLGAGRPGAALLPLYLMPADIDRTKARVELGHVSRKLEASLDETVASLRGRHTPTPDHPDDLGPDSAPNPAGTPQTRKCAH